MGAVAALQDRGYDVPGDVSVVGIDGIPGFSSSLTTIRQDFQSIARTAIDICHFTGNGEGEVASPPNVVPVKRMVR